MSRLFRFGRAGQLALSLLLCAAAGLSSAFASEPGSRWGSAMPAEQLEWIGQQVFRNECASREACLVHWNAGEAFPSLGIGHFIWYPQDVDGPFVESFPALVRFLRDQGANPPRWLAERLGQGAPWPDRQTFLAAEGAVDPDSGDPRIGELRRFLAEEKALQAAFLLRRARQALTEVAAASADPAMTRCKIRALASTAGGVYALIDYVNFKGEGLAESERYQGVGWGLLQVLETMPEAGCRRDALPAFRQAAAEVLTQRARNAEREIERQQWLPGWLNRVDTYREPEQSF